MTMLVEHWKSGTHWLAWNLLGMLGLWGTGFLIFFFTENAPWLQLVDRGQLFLYSVGVLAQVMYVLNKDRKITSLPLRSSLMYFSVACLLMSGVLFGGTVLSAYTPIAIVEHKLWWFRALGLATFVASIAMGFLVTTVAESRQDVDLEQISKKTLDRLTDRASRILDELP